VNEVGGNLARDVVGREHELERLADFLAGGTAESVLVIDGEPGIGKSTVWEGALGPASRRDVRVLRARPTEAEAVLPFATLTDLFEPVEADVLAALPAPQRTALAVALLRARPGDAPPDAAAVNRAVLNSLRSLARDRPLVVAIDDVHWVDRASREPLAFAARRLLDADVRFLLARRPGRATAIETATPRAAVQRVALEGLSLGALRRMLATQLGLTLSRRVLRQVFDATLGNPLFGLEVGRMLALRGPLAIGEELVLPDSLDDVLGVRTAASPSARRALLCVALAAGATATEVEDVVGADAVEEACDDGLLSVEGGRARPSHPLLAAAVLKRAGRRERRELHSALADAVADPGRRARHLALAHSRADAGLAATIADGAAVAAARGATEQAVELAEHALRLTPAAAAERAERVLALAEYLLRAVEVARMRSLLEHELPSLPAGQLRARGHLLLAQVPQSQEEYDHQLAQCIAESADAPELRASALAEQALDAAVSWLERLGEAERLALEARQLVTSGPAAVQAVQALAWVRILRGLPIDDLAEGLAPTDKHSDLYHSLERVEGIRLGFRGLVDDARSVFERELALAEQHGDDNARSVFHHQLCELELRAGRCAVALRLADDVDPGDGLVRVGVRAHEARVRAVAAAVRGDPTEAERWAAETLALTVGQRWDVLEAARASGIAALVAGEPERAVEPLLTVWQHTVSEEIDDPGAFPVAPDLVEASLAVGDVALAQSVVRRVAVLAEQQEHPWGLATGRRCRALVGLAEGGSIDDAAEELGQAASSYRRLGLWFDAARTLLLLGRHARRGRKWAVARSALTDAATAFDELGCTGWAEQAQAELGRVGGRRPRDADVLTPTERRVAEHAAGGLSNKEIAQALFVTVHTVEVHLSQAYRKLGLRSRTQLAGALTAPDAPKA
jgi:DNA-binding CsgD family transcriptional regulator